MLCINENLQEQLQLPILKDNADFYPACGVMNWPQIAQIFTN